MDEYPIIEVLLDAANRTEQMGSKQKFWFGEPEQPRTLFKYGRPEHGEDWAEKIAAEIAGLLGIPHAIIDLAECAGKPGTVTPDFRHNRGTLYHGNELMVHFIDPEYSAHGSHMRTKQHTVRNVLLVLSYDGIDLPHGMMPPQGVENAFDAFIGYLLLDAVVGNTDRHHENWGIVLRDRAEEHMKPAELAPTFDHASSLGRELPDADRLARLDGSDQNRTVERYLARAESRLFGCEDDDRGLSPIEAFRCASAMRADAGNGWLERLESLDMEAVAEIVARLPSARISEAASRFAYKVVESNRRELLG